MRNWELELQLLNSARDAATDRAAKTMRRDDFAALCKFAKVPVSGRQARKYNQRRGAAWSAEPAFKASLETATEAK